MSDENRPGDMMNPLLAFMLLPRDVQDAIRAVAVRALYRGVPHQTIEDMAIIHIERSFADPDAAHTIYAMLRHFDEAGQHDEEHMHDEEHLHDEEDLQQELPPVPGE